ncbi:MAG: hypothetical protein K2M04_04555 [Muribaculaceae bacterium]|nr:hypothetical protein [Muribaculaceae bacterium]
MTFAERLFEYYRQNCIGEKASTFMAFSLLLRCINYTPSKKLCYKLCAFSPPKFRRLHYSILTNSCSEKIPRIYKFSKVHGDVLFFMFLDLGIKVSKSTLFNLNDYLNTKQFYVFYDLSYIYFELLKKGLLKKTLELPREEKIDLFLMKFKATKAKREQQAKLPFWAKIRVFTPSYSQSNGIWGDSIPLRIIKIPMGGQNKKY